MYRTQTVALIIPARNESLAIPQVLQTVPSEVDHILVVDNGSTDETSRVAKAHGATVISEPRAGYGRACLAGLATLETDPPDLVLLPMRMVVMISPTSSNCLTPWQRERPSWFWRGAFPSRPQPEFPAALREQACYQADPVLLGP